MQSSAAATVLQLSLAWCLDCTQANCRHNLQDTEETEKHAGPDSVLRLRGGAGHQYAAGDAIEVRAATRLTIYIYAPGMPVAGVVLRMQHIPVI